MLDRKFVHIRSRNMDARDTLETHTSTSKERS